MNAVKVANEAPVASRPSDSSTSGGRTIRIQQLDDAIVNHSFRYYWDWLQLFECDPGAMISQHPDYVVEDAGDFLNSSNWPVSLIQSYAGDRLTGMAVLIPKDSPTRENGGIGPDWRVRGYRLAGNRLLGDLDEVTRHALLDAALSELRILGGEFLLIEDVIEGSDLWNCLHGQSRAGTSVYLPKGIQARLRIRFPNNAEDYWSQFTSKRRYNFRQVVKKMGDVECVRVTEPAQVPEFLSAAHQISRNSWQAQYLGVRIQNDQSELRSLTFLATQQALRSYLLYSGQQPVAFVVGTQHNGHFDYAEIGYDRAFAKDSPGQVLLLKVLDDLIAHNTPRCVDFGGGDAEYKQVFSNDVERSGNVWLVPSTLRAQLTVKYLQAGTALNRTARRALEITRLKTAVRRLTRRGLPWKRG